MKKESINQKSCEIVPQKRFVKPQVLGEALRAASVRMCCGMGSKATCSINRSRIS